MSIYSAGVPASEVRIRLALLLACAAAGAIHLGAVNAHMMEYRPAGYFMLVSGIAQLIWAIAIAEGTSAKVLAVGLVGNASIIAVWGVSRTVGLPFGAEAWEPERIHATDALATVMEVVVVLATMALLRPRLGMPVRWFSALAVIGATLSMWVSSEQPSRERAVALATLLIATSAPAVVILSRRSFARSVGRDHVQISFGDRASVVLDTTSRTTVGARG